MLPMIVVSLQALRGKEAGSFHEIACVFTIAEGGQELLLLYIWLYLRTVIVLPRLGRVTLNAYL